MSGVITVADAWSPIQDVIGTCDEATTYAKINEAIDELSNLGNWDSMLVNLDICSQDCEITLPDDVEVPLAINVGGRPADFRNKWFEFHMNGPGTECCPSCSDFSWQDRGDFPTFRDIKKPSRIAAYAEKPETATTIRVYGYDHCDKWIMEEDCNGVLQDGFDVPLIYGLGAGTPSAKIVKRITRVRKPITNGFVKLLALDAGSHKGSTLLGYYRPTDTEPQYRRIKVAGSNGGGGSCTAGGMKTGPFFCLCTGSCSTWVRMKARLKTRTVSQLTDVIPLQSITAIKMMCMAIRKYEADLATEYATYFELAKKALEREQKSRSGPNQIKVQFQTSYAGRLGENLI